MRPQRVLAKIVGRGVDLPAVRRDHEVVDRAVPILGEGAHGAALQVLHHEVKAIRLERRAIHRHPRQRAAIGGIARLRVPRLVIRGEIARLAGAVRRHFVDVEVGRPGFGLTLDARGECDTRSVGAEIELLIAAHWPGGHVGVEFPAQAGGRTGNLAAGVELDRIEMSLAAVIPSIPVAHEHASVDMSVLLRLGGFIDPLRRAFEVGAIRVHIHAYGEAIAARGDLERIHIDRQARDLHRFAAVERQTPHLRGAGAGRQEVQAPTIRRPARIRVVGWIARQATRLDLVGVEVE